MPINEVSRRYVKDEPSFYDIHFRWAADNVKQGSAGNVDDDTQIECADILNAVIERSLWAYELLLMKGICPEQARAVLPVDTMTEWYWSGTLGAFLDMLVLRLDNHTQEETRDVANLIAKHVQCVFPVSYEAYLGDKGETS